MRLTITPVGKAIKSPYAVRAGERIKECRKYLEWTVEELATATKGKLSGSRISNYEQGLREIGVHEAQILGAALRVAPSYLLGLIPFKHDMTASELQFLRDFRALPEKDRVEYHKRIETLALAYRTPVPDERLNPTWAAPDPSQEATRPPSKAPKKRQSAKQ